MTSKQPLAPASVLSRSAAVVGATLRSRAQSRSTTARGICSLGSRSLRSKIPKPKSQNPNPKGERQAAEPPNLESRIPNPEPLTEEFLNRGGAYPELLRSEARAFGHRGQIPPDHVRIDGGLPHTRAVDAVA